MSSFYFTVFWCPLYLRNIIKRLIYTFTHIDIIINIIKITREQRKYISKISRQITNITSKQNK